jgi:hypothetical protein
MKIKTILFAVFLLLLTSFNSSYAMDAMPEGEEMSQFTTISIRENNLPISGATVILDGQSRETDSTGTVTFDHIPSNVNTASIIYNGQTYNKIIDPKSLSVIDVNSFNAPTPNSDILSKIALVSLIIILAVLSFLLIKNLTDKKSKKKNKQLIKAYSKGMSFMKTNSLIYAIFGCFLLTLMVYFLQSRTLSQTNLTEINKSSAAEVSTLPKPQNVRVFPDDEVATVVWDAPANAAASNIVGYVVRWGDSSSGVFTDVKQTVHTVTQIQPLVNGKKYTVQVQSVQGSYKYTPTASEQGGNDTFAVANGNISLPVVTSLTPTSARKDAMKSRLTGFFDDFESSAGALDELKWNHASTNCVGAGEDGQFINSQFHAHNQTRSVYCDRAGSVSRARGIFDISGKTESNPGLIEFDLDGVSQPRDVWYVDIIAADARKDGMPLDVTSHNTSTDDDHEDPGRMIRITQYSDKLALHYYDAANNPHVIPFTSVLCKTWDGYASLQYCPIAGKQNQQYSPIAESNADLSVVPNVRRHWVVQFSPQKIKLSIDGAPIYEAVTPALFSNINKYQVHSTLFSYNTGKQFTGVGVKTSMLHWDNFGFNGPAQNIVTHNYVDGGSTGTTPLLAMGTSANRIPTGNKTTKIPVPDAIGNPVKARVMFTMEPMGGWYEYVWSNNHSISVNGKKYPFTDPRQNIQSQNITGISQPYIPHATGVSINASDLKQGLNDITFDLGGIDTFNIHLELDYDKNNAPSYTQPKDIFANFSNAVVPAMSNTDMYWFVEQDMGLKQYLGSTASIPGGTTSTNTTPTPTVTLPPAVTLMPRATPSVTATPRVTLAPTATPIPTPIATKTPVPTAIPTRTPTPAVTQAPVTSSTLRQTAGNYYTDASGNAWSSLTNSVGTVNSFTASGQVANTSDQPLYLSEKYGKTFGYSFQVPNNTYTVKLKFAEIYWSQAGQRVFNVAINGSTVLNKFDILSETSRFTALDKSFVTNVTNGKISIDFSTVTDNAKISSIEIVPGGQVQPPTQPPTTSQSGDGLKAIYTSSNGSTVTVIDKFINFNWGTGSPYPNISVDNFRVTWQGFIVPKYSQTYTFGAKTDDGVRVSVNNQQVINAWRDRASSETTGNISLTAGQRYPIKYEYYDNRGFASAQLYWSSQSQPKEIVPQSQLYSK